MKTVQGPAIFLAQFMGAHAPFDSLQSICRWMASIGYLGVQLPSWDSRCIDLALALQSKTYCDEIKGTVESCGLRITELSTHLQGQLVAVHPAYDVQFDSFAPEAVRGKSKERTSWAVGQLVLAAKASANLGLTAHATFSGASLWHTFYPWPQRPAGLVQEGFDELREYCRSQLAHYKAPTQIVFADAFPLTVTGKIQKFVMREQMMASLARAEQQTA